MAKAEPTAHDCWLRFLYVLDNNLKAGAVARRWVKAGADLEGVFWIFRPFLDGMGVALAEERRQWGKQWRRAAKRALAGLRAMPATAASPWVPLVIAKLEEEMANARRYGAFSARRTGVGFNYLSLAELREYGSRFLPVRPGWGDLGPLLSAAFMAHDRDPGDLECHRKALARFEKRSPGILQSLAGTPTEKLAGH